MKIYIANYQERVGGGWTFMSNFAKGMKGHLANYEDSEVFFICGPTMVDKEEVRKAKEDGKKIVLRLDNMPRNSRNRNTSTSRVKLFCELADIIIYQSEWAKKFLMPFTKKDGLVILNGVDTSIYNADNRNAPEDSYLYARSSRDEGKQWIMAWYWFVNNPGTLEIAGEFSRENLEYNFDFYNNERIRFVGKQPNLIDSYKRNKYFLYTYLNDACSNTLLEARASGCEIVDVYGMLSTGGAGEIMHLQDLSLERMCSEYEQQLQDIVR